MGPVVGLRRADAAPRRGCLVGARAGLRARRTPDAPLAGNRLGGRGPRLGPPGGPASVLVLVGVTWIGESVAYVVGSAIGRHRLAPVISPQKTVEGAVAQ